MWARPGPSEGVATQTWIYNVTVSATRLLILGVVRIFQPVHGYDIRRELMTWRAEEWANVAYGSIYHALNQLSRDKFIEAAETSQVGKRPARTLYLLTREGEEEFQTLLRDHWWRPQKVVDPYMVAINFMSALPKDELLAALRQRAQVCRSGAEAVEFMVRPEAMGGAPRHVAELFRYNAAVWEAVGSWADQAADKVERGELP